MALLRTSASFVVTFFFLSTDMQLLLKLTFNFAAAVIWYCANTVGSHWPANTFLCYMFNKYHNHSCSFYESLHVIGIRLHF